MCYIFISKYDFIIKRRVETALSLYLFSSNQQSRDIGSSTMAKSARKSCFGCVHWSIFMADGTESNPCSHGPKVLKRFSVYCSHHRRLHRRCPLSLRVCLVSCGWPWCVGVWFMRDKENQERGKKQRIKEGTWRRRKMEEKVNKQLRIGEREG